MAFKDYSKLTITDDFMFGLVMRNDEICKMFLEQILNIKIDHINHPEYQKDIDLKVDAHGVRLDIYSDDGKTIYNVEMQTTKKKDLAKRARYYQSQIDMNILQRGKNYSSLQESYVIFICTFDPFKDRQQYVYEFKNLCTGDFSLPLNDGALKIFINTDGKFGNVSEEFRELMQYFNSSVIPENCTNKLVNLIDNEIDKAKKNEEWRNDYMTYEQKIQDCVSIAKKKTRARDRKKSIINMIRHDLDHNFDKESIVVDIMKMYSLSRNEVEKYWEKAVSQN